MLYKMRKNVVRCIEVALFMDYERDECNSPFAGLIVIAQVFSIINFIYIFLAFGWIEKSYIVKSFALYMVIQYISRLTRY